MVNNWFCAAMLLADEANRTVLERLDPERRAAVILSLVGLGLLGVLLVVLAMLAGRWARHQRPSRSSRVDSSNVSRSNLPRPAPEGASLRGETIVDAPGDQDTKS